ncbi:hypothetical protein Salat_1161500 [Sesamum alatum]|uniref:Uncharacterized protein n=1 Tax=Sesamum alatum TaxID=300844 RepID=A0AAE1YEJ6_9LAMI|nr:hypothetical protein Salat_1161500 [Sesamum alatum]
MAAVAIPRRRDHCPCSRSSRQALYPFLSLPRRATLAFSCPTSPPQALRPPPDPQDTPPLPFPHWFLRFGPPLTPLSICASRLTTELGGELAPLPSARLRRFLMPSRHLVAAAGTLLSASLASNDQTDCSC